MEWFNLNLTKGLRLLEMCLTLLLLSWILPRLPFALSFLKQLSLFLSTPLFVFLLSNAIIATLFLNSPRFSHSHDDYPSILLNNSPLSHPHPHPHPLLPVPQDHDDDVVYHDKHILSRPNPTLPSFHHDKPHIILSTTKDKDNTESDDSDSPIVYRTTHSEKFTTQEQEPPHKLPRENKRVQPRRQSMYPHDNLTSEEFQRTVDAFIANQIRFRREESLSIVLHNH